MAHNVRNESHVKGCRFVDFQVAPDVLYVRILVPRVYHSHHHM